MIGKQFRTAAFIRTSYTTLGAALVFVTATGTAQAQESGAKEKNVIFVTARKSEENLQDVPIAVTAFSAETFEEAGLTEFADIASLTPNFRVQPESNTGSIFANVTIRGQSGGFLTLNADQAVGININGAPITRGTSLFSNLFDVEQVEILKGPQGTLYGKNTTGGVVNVTTKAPELGEFGGYAKFTYGSFDRTDGELVLNAPLGERGALRVGAAVTNRDGFGDGGQGPTFLTGNELADDNELFVRVSLLAELTDNVTIRVNGDYHDVDESQNIFRSLVDTVLNIPLAGALYCAPDQSYIKQSRYLCG